MGFDFVAVLFCLWVLFCFVFCCWGLSCFEVVVFLGFFLGNSLVCGVLEGLCVCVLGGGGY